MTLWGGSPSEITWQFTTDSSDRRLLAVDIRGSIAHARMLGDTGVVSREEADAIVGGLEKLLDMARDGSFEFSEGDEDVHTAVERRLGELIGPTAGRLHTGRSRNDQVALDIRLYLIGSGRDRQTDLARYVMKLTGLASEHASTPVASYTHLQQAQPTTLGNHLMAHASMSMRSLQRFDGVLHRLARSPLGAGASASSALPLDRDAVASELGLEGVLENTLDAVGSRDVVAEYVFVCAQAMADLSRLAEEIILWVTSEFGWARLAGAVSTGSSALPQKRNPDIAELVRGRAAAVAGDLTAMVSLQKGLPLAYNRDLQEDKRLVFHADDTLSGCLRAMGEILGGLEFDPPLPGPMSTALDFAELLVSRGVPFREAHHSVAQLTRALEEDDRDLGSVTEEELVTAHAQFKPGDIALADPVGSVRTRSAGAGEDAVRRQVTLIEEELARRNLP